MGEILSWSAVEKVFALASMELWNEKGGDLDA